MNPFILAKVPKRICSAQNIKKIKEKNNGLGKEPSSMCITYDMIIWRWGAEEQRKPKEIFVWFFFGDAMCSNPPKVCDKTRIEWMRQGVYHFGYGAHDAFWRRYEGGGGVLRNEWNRRWVYTTQTNVWCIDFFFFFLVFSTVLIWITWRTPSKMYYRRHLFSRPGFSVDVEQNISHQILWWLW